MPAVSRKQQALMGMALACKRGQGNCSGKAQDLADHMNEQDLHDFAATKHKGLPKKAALDHRDKVVIVLSSLGV